MGDRTEDWLARMEHAVWSLEKRVGKEKCEYLLKLLRDGEYATFAEEALNYYDKLYDKHFKNAEGTGGGGGTRKCRSLDVVVDEACTLLDPIDVAKQVLGALEVLAEEPVGVPDLA